MLPFNIDDQFLIRVIKDEINSEERDLFNSWLEKSDENRNKFQSLQLLWAKSEDIEFPEIPNSDEEWIKLNKLLSNQSIDNNAAKYSNYRRAISSIQSRDGYSKIHQRSHSRGIWIARLSAVVLIAFVVLYFVDREPPIKQLQTEQKVPPQMKYIWRTSKGEKATIPLSDGSIVYLNADSKLIYPRVFGNDERKLEIEGEGYFVVAEDKSRPFRVVANKIVTQAVGTEFNVRYRNDDVKIVVVDGKVNSYQESSFKKIDINKGEMLTYSKSSGFSSTKKVDVTNHTAWRKNKLAFNNTPLADVVSELELYFNIDAQIINQELIDRRLSGVFQADSLHDVLMAISISMDVNIKRDGRKIIVE